MTAKPESRIKRYSRWIKNERVDFEVFYLPFIQQILNGLANIRPLVFVMDGSEVGHECITLMVSVLYGKRALPVTWLVVKGRKGQHHPQARQLFADQCVIMDYLAVWPERGGLFRGGNILRPVLSIKHPVLPQGLRERV